MITDEAKSNYLKWKRRYDSILLTDSQPDGSLHDIQDTVGAIAWQQSSDIAAGVSRPVSLLYPKRVNFLKLAQRWTVAQGPRKNR
jgi:hypothetical protein